MATAESASRLQERRLPDASTLVMWAFGAILVIGVGYWLIGNAVD
jgi:hypothetical protein